jgi:hypothetical protein
VISSCFLPAVDMERQEMSKHHRSSMIALILVFLLSVKKYKLFIPWLFTIKLVNDSCASVIGIFGW